MRWSRVEIERLYPILEQVSSDLSPVDGKNILVLGSGSGEVVFWLAEMMETGWVTGLERDDESLEIAHRTAHEMGLEGVVNFQVAQGGDLTQPEASLDAVVREAILYPSPQPININPSEVLRVLKPGGRMVLIDVIVTQPLPPDVGEALELLGLDSLLKTTPDSMKNWMEQAGFVNLQLTDLTPTFRAAWETRRKTDRSAAHWMGYSALLEPGDFCLGKAIFYIYLRGDRPKTTNMG